MQLEKMPFVLKPCNDATFTGQVYYFITILQV
jgi:hypothetical protein